MYEVLETELERNKGNSVVGAIHFPQELNRSHLIERDLDYFFADGWRDTCEEMITPAMRRYVERIRHVGREQPHLLLAHSYARYFGDMSGGQILRRLIKKRYDLPGESGQQVYSFENVKSINDLKALYSARMNELPLSEEEVESLVEEARLIFRLNIDNFNEIAARFDTPADATTPDVTAQAHKEQVSTILSSFKSLLKFDSLDSLTAVAPYVLGASAAGVAIAMLLRR